jgi:hypothetical protein
VILPRPAVLDIKAMVCPTLTVLISPRPNWRLTLALLRNKPLTIDPIGAEKPVAVLDATHSTLKSGREKLKTELDSLIIDEHLGRQPQSTARTDKRRRPIVTRNDKLRERLHKNRAIVPEQKASEPLSGELPAAVTLALEIINTSRSAPPQLDRRVLIEQLKKDLDAVETGIASLEHVRDTQLEELKYSQVLKDEDPWFALLVRWTRELQAAAATGDQISDFMKSRFDAGYFPWRPDLLPELGVRVKLVLGSERDHDSEISKMRRRLEGLGKL